jgi:uncharacterized protein (DUF362 family)
VQWINNAIQLGMGGDAYNNLGEAYRALGRWNEAVAAYQNAIRDNPNHAEAYSNLGLVLNSAGKFGEALPLLEKAIALKPNLAWNSTPEQGGNTHPDILRAVVLAAEARKVGKITIPENTCQPEQKTFETSGANGALKGTGAKLYRPKRGDFTSVSVPKGKVCQEAKVSRDLVEADCLVNMPVAKHHGGATLSLSMKNWMGAVDNATRRAWHRNGLHQCIADFSTYLKPTLIVIDATRIMLDHGPQGPGKLAHPNEIIFATDPVAADTYAASLFGKKPEDVPHIKIAAELGVGCADLAKIKVERVEA